MAARSEVATVSEPATLRDRQMASLSKSVVHPSNLQLEQAGSLCFMLRHTLADEDTKHVILLDFVRSIALTGALPRKTTSKVSISVAIFQGRQVGCKHSPHDHAERAVVIRMRCKKLHHECCRNDVENLRVDGKE